ncbi:MAG: hypothetical protein EOP49_22980 [Sphingobacteriales bacterium]|nr:MAG: hypothetical protein EOP49_22980 [Sphingobacteriales bacterium]
MTRTTITIAMLLITITTTFAQKVKSTLYKGSIDNMPVTLYLKTIPNECGAPDNYMAMYRYDKKSNWLQLEVATNEQHNWCMTEVGFTGVMILKTAAQTATGIWISPDGKRQLKVSLKQQPMADPEQKKMEDKLEQVNYENNDC